MKKYYGKCKILGEPNFECYFEYKYVSRRDKEGIDSIIVGRDIVTNTPLYTMLPSMTCNTLEQAVSNHIIKRGKLIIKDFEKISVDDMVYFLDNLTDEKLEAYIIKIKEMKSQYLQAIINYKTSLKNLRLNERSQKENIRIKKKSLARISNNF